MKLDLARFDFVDPRGSYSVWFNSRSINVFEGTKLIGTIDWGKGQSLDRPHNGYRPCVTHCLELIDRFRSKQPKGNHARQRAKKIPPVLKVRAYHKLPREATQGTPGVAGRPQEA